MALIYILGWDSLVNVYVYAGSRFLIFCCRFVLTGGGASGARPISRLQQTDPARAEHDTEGRGRLRSGFHSAHQCGKILLYMSPVS